jgi:hypothetical protein
MTKLLIVLAATIFIGFMWMNIEISGFDSGDYITEEAYNKAELIDVKIDLDLINDLVPAYER